MNRNICTIFIMGLLAGLQSGVAVAALDEYAANQDLLENLQRDFGDIKVKEGKNSKVVGNVKLILNTGLIVYFPIYPVTRHNPKMRYEGHHIDIANEFGIKDVKERPKKHINEWYTTTIHRIWYTQLSSQPQVSNPSYDKYSHTFNCWPFAPYTVKHGGSRHPKGGVFRDDQYQSWVISPLKTFNDKLAMESKKDLNKIFKNATAPARKKTLYVWTKTPDQDTWEEVTAENIKGNFKFEKIEGKYVAKITIQKFFDSGNTERFSRDVLDKTIYFYADHRPGIVFRNSIFYTITYTLVLEEVNAQ